MLKHYDFECAVCQHVFDDYVEGVLGLPDACPKCSQTALFNKVPSTFTTPTTIVMDYPGSKRHKAGYAHIHNRPAERKGSQVVVSDSISGK